MSRTASPRLRMPVTASSRRKGSAPALRSRPSSDIVTRRALVISGVLLAAVMVVLSARTTSATAHEEAQPEPAATIVADNTSL